VATSLSTNAGQTKTVPVFLPDIPFPDHIAFLLIFNDLNYRSRC